MSGWSSTSGQTQSAYTTGDVDMTDTPLGHSVYLPCFDSIKFADYGKTPSGSSTGSAVAVSAGFSPVSIGTDTVGSLITPSTRAALYCLRPTMGLVSQNGIVPISPFFDTAGPMAKNVADIADLMDVLVEPRLISGEGSYADALTGSFSDIRIGALRPEDWFFGPSLQRPVASATTQIVSLFRLYCFSI
jgi:amidase